MRILMCVSDAPLHPINTGYRRQLTGLVTELGMRHDVRLIGYRHRDQTRTPSVEGDLRIVDYARPGHAGNAADLAMAMTLRRPLRAARLTRGLRDPLREELRRLRPDVVHVGPGKLSGLLADLEGRPAVLGVMDAWHLNVEARAEAARGVRRPLLRADARRIRRFEAARYRGWDRVVPSNEDDMRELLALDDTLPMALVPIGFDASAYAPDPAARRRRGRIIFHGAMSYAPNVVCAKRLARHVLPRVRARRPEAHLVIVGRDPAPEVRALEALAGVRVVGGVDDMRRWITTSAVWAGPFTIGTGIKTKLLEAMATNTPAVVTPVGGRGLDLASGTFPRRLKRRGARGASVLRARRRGPGPGPRRARRRLCPWELRLAGGRPRARAGVRGGHRPEAHAGAVGRTPPRPSPRSPTRSCPWIPV
jgi:glycosyltransferase involved in cell wall biosynthesis